MVERVPSRLLRLILFSLALTLATAAAAPPATPAPQASRSPAPAAPPPSLEQMPVVLVYPFDVQTGADPRIGNAIGQILAQEMTAAGGITVLPVPHGVKRTDFLENARSGHADFYISGYVTPVGDTAAVVEQVVSVDSGVILFSQTAQVSSVADVASQSLLARSQILAFVGRGTETVQAQASSTPAPTSTNGAKMPIQGIGSIVDSVFKHHGGGHTSATPLPVAKPSRGVIVAPVTASGAVASADLTNAGQELYFSLNRRFTTQTTGITSEVAQSADAICGSNRNNTIATGTLQEVAAHHGKPEVTFSLLVYTCFGATLEREVGKASSIKGAVDEAVAAYATAHPDNS
jgi:hypothetical protein